MKNSNLIEVLEYAIITLEETNPTAKSLISQLQLTLKNLKKESVRSDERFTV